MFVFDFSQFDVPSAREHEWIESMKQLRTYVVATGVFVMFSGAGWIGTRIMHIMKQHVEV